MDRVDVIVVGGGPAGSSCAGRLRAGGLDVLLLDKSPFPRAKTCAGWITPAVIDDLGLDTADYAQGRILQPFTGFRVGLIGGRTLTVSYGRPVSFGIRRTEFDDYLLRRSQSVLKLGEPLTTLRRDGDEWEVNARYRARLLVAAGGHFCPVARLLGRASPEREPAIAAQEFEIELDSAQRSACPVDPGVAELYFCDDLLGYAWCVRKGNYINVGLGRMARGDFPRHMSQFCEFLKREGRIPADLTYRLSGHAYLVYDQSTRTLVDDGLLWIGDSAGLACSQSGEGIGPAVASGLMAADAILAARGDFGRAGLDAYRRRIEGRFGRRRAGARNECHTSVLRQKAARWLLGRRWFVDRVLIKRWFLRA
jgi:menaquinone-9 beta-reductase